jgi:hypothetical protein
MLAISAVIAVALCVAVLAQTDTSSPTVSQTRSQTQTRTQTGSRTQSPSNTATMTQSRTPTQTVTMGLTPTATQTRTSSQAVTPGPPPCSWSPQGCFNDPDPLSSVLPYILGSVSTLEACEDAATLRGFNTAGVVNGGECRAGSNSPYRCAGAPPKERALTRV